MKLAIIQCINGNYSIVAEGIETEQAALTAFHNRCGILWNASDVITGEVAIINEQLETYNRHREYIYHELPQPENTEEPENS